MIISDFISNNDRLEVFFLEKLELRFLQETNTLCY